MTLPAKLLAFPFVIVCGLAAYTFVASWIVERHHPPLGEFMTVNGVRLHYVDVGDGSPLILLHGASASLRDFQASIIPELAKHHRVIAFDRPGYGFSDRPPGSWLDPAEQAALFHTALQELGVTRPVVVGHSWSGSVALAYMLNYPTDHSGGVLLAGTANAWTSGVSWHVALARRPLVGRLFAWTAVFPLGQLTLDRVIASVFAPEQPTPEYRRRTGAILALRPGPFRASAQDISNLSSFLAEQSKRYEQIEARLLLITGSGDSVVSARIHTDPLAERVSHARRVVLHGAGHALHHSRTEEVVRLIRNFAQQG